MAKTNEFQLIFGKFYQGLSPVASSNSLTSFGNTGHASSMTNADVLSPDFITQGSGLSTLTDATTAVTELVSFIMDKAVSDNVSYAIGATKLFKLSATAVVSGTTITSCADGESLIDMGGNLYGFYNTSSAGDILKMPLSTGTIDPDWGCYTNDTEVLTIDGWRLIKDVMVGEKVYSMNPTTHRVEIAINRETISKPYDGEIISFKSEGIDLSVTPDHKMFAGFRKYPQGKKCINYGVIRADKLLNKTQFRLKKNAIWDGKTIDEWEVPEYDNGSKQEIIRDNKGRIITTIGKRYYRPARKFPIKPFLRLLGFYISEGSSSEKAICISQRTYSKGWQPIKDTLDELGLNYGYYGQSFDIHDKQLTQYIKKLIPGLCHEKRIPKEILNLHPSLLTELYESLMLGDGYLETNQYYTVSEGLRDDFIELINRLGWSAKVFIKDRRGQKAYNGIARYILYTIGVTKRKNEQCLNKKVGDSVKEGNYKGNIVCLVLDINHIMLVRRNGKSVWCGNSTVPTGFAALQKALHPSATKEDLILFGNGRYCGVYTGDSDTLAPTKLDFGIGNEVADVMFHANYWWIAVNSGVSGTNRNLGSIYLYAGGATTSILSDETSVGVQRIGFLYPLNGVVYVAYQDLSSTAGYKIGYIVGRQLKPLGYFSGSLPSFAQRTLYKNTILFISNHLIYSAGAVIEELPVQISQLADGGFATVGAMACPFGTPLISSTESTSYKIAKFSGYDTNSNWRSIIVPLINDRYIGYIDSITVLTNTLVGSGESASRCDLILEYNQGSSTSATKQITGAGIRRHIFNVGSGTKEDVRVFLNWANGNTTNNVAIREVQLTGHWCEK